ncbi:MAG: AraC family transcriptional regulator [Candidatus Thiodiazotropha sp. (ex Ctena orbiculata)]|nr:AraC family transcriptional regulator [Candidatus Thiodiazotropha taylori]MBT2996910.1 AraC family transcriptional regulator [Candidatus Thiodiazotropha taylori]MBT3000765.1 AraC family transcriptional regulator [Candidatus Thiodiazotropha taylori]MBV2107860.1 AraC family transcriptional regulator [Candidatus Thiodiazotropha taylori]MBV2110621.1 AraC family transcriptional regulator [Candidatus Thiodiazotropha taylori]
MKNEIQFTVNQGWKVLLNNLGVSVTEVLQRAELPVDLFTRKGAGLSTQEYFRLWHALEVTFDDPAFPLKISQSLNTDVFDPPIFAAYCSPNLNTALQRLSKFKPLIGPMKMDVEINDHATSMTLEFLEKGLDLPTSLISMEIGFFVQLARMASKEHMIPLRITSPIKLPCRDKLKKYFGVAPTLGDNISITFSAEDARKPFLTENVQMWEFFEQGLRKRLSEVSIDEGMTERVRSALLELLPSGQTTADDVASRLLVSRRTLQRRLGEEGTSFKAILMSVREELARHYITNSELPYIQISFLLGYEDPNSFFRAFHSWTGTTPDSFRTQAVH